MANAQLTPLQHALLTWTEWDAYARGQRATTPFVPFTTRAARVSADQAYQDRLIQAVARDKADMLQKCRVYSWAAAVLPNFLDRIVARHGRSFASGYRATHPRGAVVLFAFEPLPVVPLLPPPSSPLLPAAEAAAATALVAAALVPFQFIPAPLALPTRAQELQQRHQDRRQ